MLRIAAEGHAAVERQLSRPRGPPRVTTGFVAASALAVATEGHAVTFVTADTFAIATGRHAVAFVTADAVAVIT